MRAMEFSPGAGFWDKLQEVLLRADHDRAWRERWAPEMSYGRHFGPPMATTRQAAVLILFCRDQDGWFLPLTVRTQGLKHHGGQISLPGGGAMPSEVPEQTALRETQEELGIDVDSVRLLGRLSKSYLFVSDFEVTPCVGILGSRFDPQPDPAEVERVIRFPLDRLLDPTSYRRLPIHRGAAVAPSELPPSDRGVLMMAPALCLQGAVIWGATAIVLGELIELLRVLIESNPSVED